MHFLLVLGFVVCMLMGECSADVNADIQALQNLVQQQSAAISSLKATVSSQQVRITGLESKVQTLSQSVAFTAMFSHDEDADNGVHIAPYETLKFDLVTTNGGNAYNPTTGIFTAPLPGYYAFSIVAMMADDASHPNLCLGVVKNGAVVDKMWVENEQKEGGEQGSTHTAVHLAGGDRIWIQQEGYGDGVRGSYWTVFTGYLLHAD